ncbi:MAG: hypothetical protein AABW51_03410 [Nanoarchaeota archaeon]
MNAIQEKTYEKLKGSVGRPYIWFDNYWDSESDYLPILGYSPGLLDGSRIGEVNKDGSVLIIFPDHCEHNPNGNVMREINAKKNS